MTVNVADNRYGVAQFIVAPTIAEGANYTTIASAITAAVALGGSRTIFIRPGTYTENVTLPANINLTAFVGDQDTPAVTISGTITATDAGNRTITGIRLQTNGSFFLTVSGIAATVVFLESCRLNCTNNTGISFTSSSANSVILANNCIGDIAIPGISYSVSSSAGHLIFFSCGLNNTGSSTTATTASAGGLSFDHSLIVGVVSSTGTAALNFYYSRMVGVLNTIPATFNGVSPNNGGIRTFFLGGSATAIAMGAGSTIALDSCSVSSSNALAISGSGTLTHNGIAFGESSSNIAATITQIQNKFGPNILAGASVGGVTNVISVENASNTASSQALFAATVGGATAGDPFSTYTVTGVTAWAQGIDNSATGDPFVLSASGALGTTNVMSATTAGAVSFVLGNVDIARSASGAIVGLDVANTSNTASSDARIQTFVGGASAGDPFTLYNVSGVTAWSTGLDNSDSDAYVISNSTSLGTNNVMRASTAGEVNFPLTPAFLATLNSNVTNVLGTAGTFYTLGTTALTEVFDQGADFNTNGTFTAPITGRYYLQGASLISGGTAVGETRLLITTSNRTYRFANRFPTTATYCGIWGSALVDMDAADTCTFVLEAIGEAGNTDDVSGSTAPQDTWVSGYLAC